MPHESESNTTEVKPKSVTVKLLYPIKWGDEEKVTEVTLKRPKGKHIKRIGRDVNIDELLKIASKISEYTPAFFDELDAVDCLKITEVIGDFLDTGPAIGKTV